MAIIAQAPTHVKHNRACRRGARRRTRLLLSYEVQAARERARLRRAYLRTRPGDHIAAADFAQAWKLVAVAHSMVTWVRVRELPRKLLPRRPLRRVLLNRPKPRAPVSKAAPPEGPPEGDSESEGEGGDGDEPPLAPLLALHRAKRGRPRKARSFRAFPGGRIYRKRLKALDQVAAALEGRPDALFVTLTPGAPPSKQDRLLARVPAHVARSFSDLARRLRRDGATFALAQGTRAENGALCPHAHAILAGVTPERLAVLAARSGLRVHAEPLQNPKAAARYMVAAHQRRHYDRLEGARGFYAHIPNETPASSAFLEETSAHPAPTLPPGAIELNPGVRIIDPLRFIRSTLADLEAGGRFRDIALAHSTALARALGMAPPRDAPEAAEFLHGLLGGGS